MAAELAFLLDVRIYGDTEFMSKSKTNAAKNASDDIEAGTAAQENTDTKKKKLNELFIQFIKFNAVGILNTLIDYGVLWLLNTIFPGAEGLRSVLFKAISFSCGAVNSYFCNRKWTFKAEGKSNRTEFIKFFAINTVSLLASLGIYALCENVFSMSWFWSNVVTSPVVILINFTGNKLLVFKDGGGSKPTEKQ